MAQSGTLDTPQVPTHIPHDSALSIGSTSTKAEDETKIRDLEEEVRLLAEKANTASQRFADYENDIRVLEAKLRQEQRKNTATVTETATADGPSPAAQAALRPGISRFGSFIGSRKTDTSQQNGHLQTPGEREKELEQKLIKEQTLRIAAEDKVQKTSAEMEELSATLFQEANEMVATERKENAALRAKLEQLQTSQKQQQVLEKQPKAQEPATDSESLQLENTRLRERVRTLEQRELDRKKRLERLEAANKRIERVRALLVPP